jgi:putative transposase
MVENTKANTIIVGDLNVQQMAQPKIKDVRKKRRPNKRKVKIALLKV